MQLLFFSYVEPRLVKEKSDISLKVAAELTQNMYAITHQLLWSKQTKFRLPKMDERQAELLEIIQKIQGVAKMKTGGNAVISCFLIGRDQRYENGVPFRPSEKLLYPVYFALLNS